MSSKRAIGGAMGLIAGLALTIFWVAASASAGAPDRATKRVVSLNPSLTSILLAIGATETLVGVDEYSARQHEAVASLVRVGGLFNPSLEAVVSLQPDLVILVPGAEQRDFRQRLEALKIRVEPFENTSFDAVLENIERLGALTGRGPEARARIEAIHNTRSRVEGSVASLLGEKRSRPKLAMVLQRDPLYVTGGRNFIDTMLRSAGGENVAGGFSEPYPRVAMEWFIAARPEIIIDLSPEAQQSMEFWNRWPNIPAVKKTALVSLDAETISMPGPDLDRSLEILARAIWGEAWDDVWVEAPSSSSKVSRDVEQPTGDPR